MPAYTPEEMQISRMVDKALVPLENRVRDLENKVLKLKEEVHTLKFPLE